MSTIHIFKGEGKNLEWEGVDVKKYGNEFEGVTKQIFIGPQENSQNFHMRYFRLEPGTHSNLEQHPHDHGVLILHGQAVLQLKNEFTIVSKYDAVFISGGDVHQFVVKGDEPLGFLCVIKPK